MNFKKTALLMAMAGVTAAPVVAQADMYASARIGLENVDTGGVSDFRVRSFGSRFGVKSETDLGNGMTGYGKYEWDVDFRDHNEDVNTTDPEDGDADDIDVRHRMVGLMGDFGKVYIGQTYHTFYNFVVGPLDNPWWGSGYRMIAYTGRTDGAISYEGSAGDVKFGGTAYFLREGEEDAPDRLDLAASFGIGDMTLALGLQTSESTSIGNGIADSSGDPESVVAVTLHGIGLGSAATLGVGFMSQEDDSSIVLDLGIGNAYVHFETESLDAADRDPTFITLGYTQSLGKKTTMYYELVSNDADTDDSDDDATVMRAVLKYDIE